MRNLRACGAAAAVLVGAGWVGTGWAGADVLYNNFGPGDSYLGDTGWSVANGGPFGAHIEEAVSFIIPDGGAGYFLDSAAVAMGYLGGPNVLHATLRDDNRSVPGGAPGAALETVTVVDAMPPMPTDPGANHPPVMLAFSGTTALVPGQRYWLTLSTDTTTDSWAAWHYNVTSDLGQRAFRQDGGAWNVFSEFDPRATFRINGTPVPAPASLAAAGLGAAVVLRRRRR